MTSTKSVTIAANCVHAKIIGSNDDIDKQITKLLSYQIELRNSTAWASFYNHRSHIFPAGFVHMVGRELVRLGYDVSYAIKNPPKPLGPTPGTNDITGFGFTERYDYQPETVKRLLKHGRGIARISVGGGKSNIAVMTYDAIRRPTLFLTTRSALMWQMKAGYEKCGINPGIIGEGQWKPRGTVTVAMVQTIAARLKLPTDAQMKKWSKNKIEKSLAIREQTIKYLESVEVIIGEEAHEVGGESYFEIMNSCKNASYRLALTATPWMRDDVSNMRLQAAFGSVLIDVSEEELINKGILATPYFRTVTTPKPDGLYSYGMSWPRCYDLGIVENVNRNSLIVDEAIKGVSNGLTVLILVQRENHGVELRRMLINKKVEVKFINGKSNNEERQKALNDFASRKTQVLIGSSILDVGVDVPAIGMVILAGAGKAEVNHRQRIGRGLRAKKKGSNIAFFIDFDDHINKHLAKHAATRKAILTSTKGFAERTMNVDKSLPYELLKGSK